MGLLYYDNKSHFLREPLKTFDRESIIKFLNEKGIALYDTASSIKRLQDNASDKFLEVVEQTDIRRLLNLLPQCKAIVTTGQKATETFSNSSTYKEPSWGIFQNLYLTIEH